MNPNKNYHIVEVNNMVKQKQKGAIVLIILFTSAIAASIGMFFFIKAVTTELNNIKQDLLNNRRVIDEFISLQIDLRDNKQSELDDRLNTVEVRLENNNSRWESNYKELSDMKELNIKNYEFLIEHCNKTSEKIDNVEKAFIEFIKQNKKTKDKQKTDKVKVKKERKKRQSKLQERVLPQA